MWTRNGLTQQTTYWYFGRNAGHPGGQPWGEYHYITDPNGQQVNRVWYDAYGRVTKVIQPGDDDTYPTVEYVYGDAGQSSVSAPLKIETWQRETAGCGGCATRPSGRCRRSSIRCTPRPGGRRFRRSTCCAALVRRRCTRSASERLLMEEIAHNIRYR
ncbi:MAG: hypothetical protein HC853_17055, partial [Anaerolineae bacterium]|nr:hypothetical protein [Anaerolineae bacterium]